MTTALTIILLVIMIAILAPAALFWVLFVRMLLKGIFEEFKK